jgi:hypothetical protein
MALTLRMVLILVAVVCFVLAAAGVASRVNLQAAGLACWATAALLP